MSEKRDLNDILSRLADQFLLRNYDCLYLRAMLDKCASAPEGSTLIVGSSHALNGIQESAWHYAVNCSMHSQDIYYDYVCARRALLSAGKGRFWVKQSMNGFGQVVSPSWRKRLDSSS